MTSAAVTPIRVRRSQVVHLTRDASGTLCGRTLKRAIIEPDAVPTCRRCMAVLL